MKLLLVLLGPISKLPWVVIHLHIIADVLEHVGVVSLVVGTVSVAVVPGVQTCILLSLRHFVGFARFYTLLII